MGIILTASGFAAKQVGYYAGPFEYNGYLVFDYPEGDNPIVNIVFNIDPEITDYLIMVDVPEPWSYTYNDGALTLSGGSLNPGGTVSITVSIDEYTEPGEYHVTSVGTTSAGEVSNAAGPLLVGDLYLLRAIHLANMYNSHLLVSIIGLTCLEMALWYRKHSFTRASAISKEQDKFLTDADKILNKEETPKVNDLGNKPDPDLDHKSVIDELYGHDESKPLEIPKGDKFTQHSMYPPGEDPSELFRDLTGAGEGTSDGSKNHSFPLGGGSNLKWAPLSEKALDNLDNFGKARTPEEIAKKIGDSFIPETDKSDAPKTGDETPKTTKETPELNNDPDNPDQKDEDMSGASDLADYELYKSPSDRAKELSLEKINGGSTDSVEYDDSDLPGLDEIPDPPSTDSIELDDSDLPGLDEIPDPEPSENGLDDQLDLGGSGKKLPRIKPDESIDG